MWNIYKKIKFFVIKKTSREGDSRFSALNSVWRSSVNNEGQAVVAWQEKHRQLNQLHVELTVKAEDTTLVRVMWELGSGQIQVRYSLDPGSGQNQVQGMLSWRVRVCGGSY